MAETYKVRMTVLALMKGNDPRLAQDDAVDLAVSAGLTVLHVEDPEKVKTPIVYRDEGDPWS